MRALRTCLPALLSVLALGACSHTSSSPATDGVTFADPPIPATAVSTGRAPSDRVLRLVLGLERDSDGLAQRVRDIATPGSPYYHRRQTVADTAAEFGATPDTIAAIVSDLEKRGLPVEQNVTGAFVATSLTVEQAEDLFRTTIGTYRLGGRGTFVAPAGSPSAPAAWRGVVREVLGLSTLPSLDDASDFTVIDQPGSPDASGTPQGCADALAKIGFKPNELLAAYGVAALRDQGYAGQGIRLAVVEDGGFLQGDIDTFTACYGIATPVTPTVVLTGGLTEPLPENDEATLDLEVALAVAPQLAGLYVFESTVETLADRVVVYAAPLDPANTGGAALDILSSSLGQCEQSLTQSSVALMEHVFATAAAANVSVFASAGDSGSSTCYHHDGSTEELSASYPATSAYTLAVGGTNLLLDASNAISGSSVWNNQPWNGVDSAGGGGPSIYVAAPSWQSGTGTGDTMRTTPDVSFFADPLPGYTIYNSTNGGWYDDGGTSAATPLLAASVALLHQAMLAEQNAVPVVAYEWISGLAASSANEAFYDIVLGDNDLFGVGCCTAGPGYDQASGWGSMNLGAVSTALNSSPQYRIAVSSGAD